MKVQIASDLHLEFFPPFSAEKFIADLKHPDADVLVLAGDIVTDKCIYLLEDFCKVWKHVVYVTGNHEYIHKSFDEIHEKLNNLQSSRDNFHWLNNTAVEIEGQRFIGGTLWFEENHVSEQTFLQRNMLDFNVIKNFDPFTAHEETRRFLNNNIQSDDIVVTHHMANLRCVARKFQNSMLNCFFVTDLSDMTKKLKPKIWIAGHSHSSYDFIENDTRFLANPYGYHNTEINLHFRNDLLIEV